MLLIPRVLYFGSVQDEETNEEENGAFNLWTLAAQVADSMKQQAAEVVTTVHETNWSSELAVFGKAVQNETAELSAKTVKALEDLPDQVGAQNLEFGRNLAVYCIQLRLLQNSWVIELC